MNKHTALTSLFRRTFGRRAMALAATAIAAGAFTGDAAAAPSGSAPADASGNYAFHTLDNNKDQTFNQLLGINEFGTIAGYFGSGQASHANKGYLLRPNYHQGNYRNENFPGSVQTQVTGLNNIGVTVGFWSNMNNANNTNPNFGFYTTDGHHFHSVNFPTGNNASPPVNQLLGVNDSDIAVGFYTDSKATNHGYSYDIRKHRFHRINVSGDSNLTAAGINNWNDVAGFATNSAGVTEGYLLRGDGKLFRLNYPGATATQAFGVNDGDEVVGAYTVGTGNAAMTHGFVWTPGFGFMNVDDPNGIGATTINGVNDHGDLVGFYTDSAGNVDGLLAKPQQ
jgi:hypothetical protein